MAEQTPETGLTDAEPWDDRLYAALLDALGDDEGDADTACRAIVPLVDKIVADRDDLRAQLDQARAERDFARTRVKRWEREASVSDAQTFGIAVRCDELVAERDEARARLAAVEALRDQWACIGETAMIADDREWASAASRSLTRALAAPSALAEPDAEAARHDAEVDRVFDLAQLAMNTAYGTDDRHALLARAVSDAVAAGADRLPVQIGRHFGQAESGTAAHDAEVAARTLEEAAAWLRNGDEAESVAYDGPSNRGEVLAAYHEALEDPECWLSMRADHIRADARLRSEAGQ